MRGHWCKIMHAFLSFYWHSWQKGSLWACFGDNSLKHNTRLHWKHSCVSGFVCVYGFEIKYISSRLHSTEERKPKRGSSGPPAFIFIHILAITGKTFKNRLNICGDVYRWCLICLLPTYLCHLSDRQNRQDSFSRVDILNSCCCNTGRNSWKAHLCTRSVSINISHVQKLLWGRNSLWNGTIINHCLQGTSSYLCLSLWWLIPAEMGLAHLIKRREPCTCISHPTTVGCGGMALMT